MSHLGICSKLPREGTAGLFLSVPSRSTVAVFWQETEGLFSLQHVPKPWRFVLVLTRPWKLFTYSYLYRIYDLQVTWTKSHPAAVTTSRSSQSCSAGCVSCSYTYSQPPKPFSVPLCLLIGPVSYQDVLVKM